MGQAAEQTKRDKAKAKILEECYREQTEGTCKQLHIRTQYCFAAIRINWLSYESSTIWDSARSNILCLAYRSIALDPRTRKKTITGSITFLCRIFHCRFGSFKIDFLPAPTSKHLELLIKIYTCMHGMKVRKSIYIYNYHGKPLINIRQNDQTWPDEAREL